MIKFMGLIKLLANDYKILDFENFPLKAVLKLNQK